MREYFLLALAGSLSVASYAPLEYWWLMPLCLMVIYFYWSKETSPLQAFKQGFVFAFFQFLVGVSWVYVSLHTFGNMPPVMAGIAVILFVLIWAVLHGLVGYVFALLSSKSHKWFQVILFASLWVIADWSRTFIVGGFPWLDVGYSQTTRFLSSYAPIGGVYLVSFALLLISAFFMQLLMNLRRSKQGVVIPALSIVCISASAIALKPVQWTEPTGEAISVALVQADIPIESKWEQSFRDELLTRYYELLPKSPTDLVVFAETALPFYLHNTTDEFWESLSANAGSLIAGVIESDPITGKLYNSAVMTCGAERQVYRKHHLVPFGEYLPLRRFLSWLLDYLQIPMSDFSSWKQPQSLDCGGLKVALSICYEDAFSGEIRSNLNDGEVLVNISEDAWFGDSLAPHQRRQMAQMRAQELSRPMVRSSNSGPSNLIDENGSIIVASEQFSQQTVAGEIMPRAGKTPFLSFGLWVIHLSGLIVFCAVVNRVIARKQRG